MEANGTFDPRKLPRSFYDRKIKELRDEHRRLTEAANEVNEEIKWWVAGRDQFAPGSEGAGQPALDGLDVPEPPVEEPPSLRAKIRFVVQQGDRMKPAEVIEALRDRGWMPTAKTAPQMIRNRMLSMLDDDELVRDDD
ncbi:MAG: hypothetical protein ACLQBB_02690, partial [Solirubrobacteraceae bacterium]